MPLRTFVNAPGIEYDETKTHVIYAEDLNAIKEAVESIEPGGGSGYTILVAADDATVLEKAAAWAVCDGEDDHVEINNALDLIREIGGKVELSSGTFELGAAIDLRGNSPESDDNPTIIFEGQGIDTTKIIGGATTDVILTGQRAKFISGRYTITVRGAGDGLKQVTGTERGNWQSLYHNIFIKSDFVTHTGWGINMECPFRMRFENIEMNGVANGLNLETADNGFNPGNLTIDRMFIDLLNSSGNVNAIAFRIGVGNNDATEVMNLVKVDRLDIYGGNLLTNSTGILIEGASESYGESRHHSFRNLNIEDVKFAFDMKRGRNCTFLDVAYTRVLNGGTVFRTNGSADNNHFENIYIATNGADTITLINDGNDNGNLPNSFERIHGWGNGGATYNNSLKSHTIVRRLDLSGGGPTVNDLAEQN